VLRSHIAPPEKGAGWMEFTSSGPDIVRSDTQRRLLDHWAARRDHAGLPIWSGFDADAIKASIDYLALTEIVGGPDDARFQLVFHGWRLQKSFGDMKCVGMFLDEILPAPYLRAALATYSEAMNTKLPVYTVSDMRDPTGKIVHHERLILPFSVGGVVTERILASIEAVSPEGPFEIHELMKAPIRPPVIALCATIQC
jgi:hypothetical protein